MPKAASKTAKLDQPETITSAPTTDGAAATTLPDGTPFPTDAGALIHRDKSGTPLGATISEGKANFGAITAAAQSVLPPADAE